jgi:hypothetical protein
VEAMIRSERDYEELKALPLKERPDWLSVFFEESNRSDMGATSVDGDDDA